MIVIIALLGLLGALLLMAGLNNIDLKTQLARWTGANG